MRTARVHKDEKVDVITSEARSSNLVGKLFNCRLFLNIREDLMKNEDSSLHSANQKLTEHFLFNRTDAINSIKIIHGFFVGPFICY